MRSILSSEIGTRFEILHFSPTGVLGFHQPRIRAFLQLLRAVAVFPFLMLFRRPAIVQVHTSYGVDFWRSALFVLSSWAGCIPIVLIIHGSHFDRTYEDAGTLQRAAIRLVLRRASAIHVRGEYWRRVLQSIDPGLPVYLLPTTTDPVDEPAIEPTVKWRAPTVLFVGGTASVKDNVRKGLPNLLAISARLVAEVPQAKVRVAGPKSGDPWKDLLGPEAMRHVEFMGSLTHEELSGLYRSAAIFVLPSHAEGMPNAILEAMAHGLPIVATTVGSIPEVVEHNVGGYLLPPGDEGLLVSALIRLLQDPQNAVRMGEHNRAVVLERFTNRHTADRLSAVYATLLSGQQRATRG